MTPSVYFGFVMSDFGGFRHQPPQYFTQNLKKQTMKILLKMKIFLSIAFLINSSLAYGFMWGEWQEKTPGGNIMGDNGSGNALEFNGAEEYITLKVNQWYFYKNNIIGTSEKGYFIVNENQKELFLFKTELEWRNAIAQYHLKPTITRWYSDNWVDMEWIMIWLVFGFIITIPLFCLFLWILYRAIFIEHLDIAEPHTTISLGLILLFIFVILFDSYPSSF
jgi:hypothetical protein